MGSPANWAPLGLGETVVADITVAAGGHSASAGEEGRREEAPDAHGTVGHGGEKTRVEKQEGVKGKKVLWGGFQPFLPFFFKIRVTMQPHAPLFRRARTLQPASQSGLWHELGHLWR